jgi:hypothetical protein
MRKACATFLALTVLPAAGCGSASKDESPPEAAEPKAKSIAVGEGVTLGDMSYRIYDAETMDPIKTHSGTTYKARNGVFVVLKLALANKGSNGNSRVTDEDIALIGGDGKRYMPTAEGSRGFHLSMGPHTHDPKKFDPKRPDPIYGWYEVLPGATRSASAVFDVPESATAGARFEVKTGGGQAVFDLGI